MRQVEASAETTRHHRLLKACALVFLGSLVMTAASWVEVPMVPVPMNLQSLAAPLLGMVMGGRLGAASVMLWLGQACLGLPVLSGGASGVHHFVGPTAGYLIAFPLATMASGLLWDRLRSLGFVGAATAMLAGNAIILGLGVLWLAVLFGWSVALTTGLYPFVSGALMKSAAGAGLAVLGERWRPRR
jgi:biotin transport system substrate-specific component